ncbi:ABC transporter permease subunit [Dietzia sp. 179-F 9C3 NHS]|uniref:ABC transporter permease subunit n=1 Tax=Dietzia sp. 179-F 9C3 NHS TaxID=3374295 RepID=UPI0038791A92
MTDRDDARNAPRARRGRPWPLPATVLVAVAVYAVCWPALAPTGWGASDYQRARQAPGWPHLAGTDSLGFDVSVRVAEALRVSLTVAVSVAVAATVIGVLVGALAAASGGWIDAVVMRVTDTAAAVPHLLATIVVVALFGGSLSAIIIALALTHWTTLARIVRAETQKVMASDYVAVTRAAGASRTQVVRHHVLPAVAPQSGIAVVMMVPHAIWHESTLSFLGVGLPPEQASLGTLIHASRAGLLDGQWWPLVAPSAVLIAVTAAIAALRPSRRRRLAGPPVGLETGDGDGLAVDGLTVRLPSPCGGWVHAVTDLSVAARPGRVLAVVGESGAGKSTLAAAIAGLLPSSAHTAGQVRAGRVGHVPQNPSAAFTPTRHLRSQLAEIRAVHHVSATVDELCRRSGLDPALADRYPHQLSGGQLQRAAVAAALACDPAVIVADEPTSSLDTEATRATLTLLRTLADDTGAAVLVVSHDLRALAATGIADTVAVLYAGHLVDLGPAQELLAGSGHPYTRALVAALPAHGLRPLPGSPPSLTGVDPSRNPWPDRGLDVLWPPAVQRLETGLMEASR